MYTNALRDAHAIGWETGGAVVFFLCCLLLLWHYREKDTVAAGVLIPYVPVTMLVVYFPLLANIISSKFATGSVYIRLHWLFFMIPVTAASFTELIGNNKKRIKRIIPFLLLILLIHPYYQGYFSQAESAYKIPDTSIDVSNLILSDCGETPSRVLIQWHENVNPYFNDDTSASSEFHYGIRMYASNLILNYCILTEETWSSEGFDLTSYIPTPYDYIVVRDEEILKDGCSKLGYELMDTVDGYAVFKRGNTAVYNEKE